MKSEYIELIAFCLGCGLFTLLIPNHYTVEQEYKVTGPLIKRKQIAHMTESLLEPHGDPSDVSCQYEDTARNLRCIVRMEKRSLASKIKAYMSRDLTDDLGYVPRSDLEARVKSARRGIENAKDELALLGVEQSELDKTKVTDEDAIRQATQEVKKIERNLTNRKNQLEIITQALEQRKGTEAAALFTKKKEELETKVKELEIQLEGANVASDELQKSTVRRDEVEKREKELSAFIESKTKDIDRWNLTINTNPSSDTLADPDAFQLDAIKEGSIKPKRTVGHIPYGLLFGFLLFSVYRRKDLSQKAPDLITSPERVEQLTGLKRLAHF